MALFSYPVTVELLLQALVSCLVLLLVYATGLGLYRLYFHPYAKYPGPFWAKVSYFRAFYYAWMKDTQPDQARLHTIYGPIVRYNPDSIMFIQPDSIKEIYQVGKNFNKGRAYHPMNTNPEKSNLVFNPSKKEHGRRRRIIGPGFTDSSVRNMAPMIVGHIATFCDTMLDHDGFTAPRGSWSSPKNLEDWFFWLGQDINSELIVGRSFNLLTSNDLRKSASIMQGGLRRNSLIFQYPQLFRAGINRPLDFGTWFLPNVMENIMGFMGFATESVFARISEGKTNSAGRPDVLQSMIDTIDPETGSTFTPEDIAVESTILLLAGGDTIGTALQILFWAITCPWNAHVLAKLAQEIRTTFGSENEITTGPKLNSCAYLEACVSEALRNFTGSAFWREAEKGGATVCGNYIPEGLAVGTCASALHRDANIFPDPYKFDPDRFILGSKYSDEQVTAAKAASQPFAVGPRSCIAKTLARTMMSLTTAMAIFKLEFEAVSDGEGGSIGGGGPGMGPLRTREEEYQLYGSFTVSGRGPILRFKAREF